MVQQPRQEKPLYSCTVPVESVTGHPDEELMTFGASPEEVKSQAEQMLVSDYGCKDDVIRQLMQKARIESLSPWCSSSDRQGS